MIKLHFVETSGVFPTSIYQIMLDGNPIGECQVRHRPSKHENLPTGFESHIFYEINSEFRGHGYAKQALQLLLQEAKRFGLDQVIIVADENNLASNAVVRSSGGGVLLEKGEALGGVVYLKYRVSLKAIC